MSDIQQIFAFIFWTSLLLLFHNYIGICLSLMVVSAFRKKNDSDTLLPASFILPTVTILVPAHNEEEVIGEKVENLLELDYPADLIEIVVASDVSTDHTVEIVNSFSDRGVKLIDYRERHGKLGIIDELIPRMNGEIVVITDANVILAKDALRRMMKKYSDPIVGTVGGDLKTVLPSGSEKLRRETTYRQFENHIKRLMSQFGAQIGLFGGFYSLRRSLFRPLGSRPVHDDVILPLEVLAQGYKAVYAENAVSIEETQRTVKAEYLRRVRMTTYNLNSISRLVGLAFRSGVKVLYLAVSYKLLRWFAPYLLALMLVSSTLLIGSSWLYNVIAALFGFGLLIAGIGGLRVRFGGKGGITTDVYHFAAMNFAAFIGIGYWIKGARKYWETRSL